MVSTSGQNGTTVQTEQAASAAKRPRALLVAYACDPNYGSESGIGWNRAVEAAKLCDTWVICEETEFAEGIRRHLATHGEIPGLHFEFVPQLPAESLLWRVPGLGYVAYRLWHRRALKTARRLHEQLHFDLVHQVTFGTFREPGDSWKLDAPWIWGPFGGTQNFPWRFLGQAGAKGAILETARNVLNTLQLKLSPRVRRAARRADAIVAATSTVQRDFQSVHGIMPHLLNDVGIHRTLTDHARREPSRPLRLLWAGHLITRKALNLLIEALARLPGDVSYEVRVAGEGPEKKRWQRLARRRGVDRHITWTGRLSHGETLQQYAWADVFAFTSLRDTTGTVIVEALGNGLPVICLDHQGAHDVVTPECGIKIPVTTPHEVIGQLAEAIASLAGDTARWQRLSQGAIERAQQHYWPRHGEQMRALYREVLERNARRCSDSARLKISAEQNADHSVANRFLELGRNAAMAVARPIETWFGRPRSHGFGILLYHRIAAPVAGVPRPTYNVTPSRFRAQLRGLLARGYKPWSLRRALQWHRMGWPIPPKTFVVTFDDAYENIYSQAWPILRELGIPATIFLTTAHLDSQSPFPFDDWSAAGSTELPIDTWRPISTRQCAEMAAGGLIELGSHTHTHQDFAGRAEAFAGDLRASLAVLKEKFGLVDATLAFPFGICGPELVTEARRMGFLCGLTTVGDRIVPGSDPMSWGRITVDSTDSDMHLATKIDGWYRVAQDTWHCLRRWSPIARARA